MFDRRIFCLALAVTLLQACETTGATGGRPAGTLERIAASGQINLGVREDTPPMSFRDQSGNVVGYSIDLCGHVADAVKRTLGRSELSVNYVPVTAETRFDAIAAGRIDLLCGATTKTLSRAEQVGFTQLTFATGSSLMSLEGGGVAGINDLKGKRVAASAGTTTIEALRRALSAQNIDAEVVPVGSAEEGMELLDSGDVAAFSADQVVLIGLIIARPSDRTYALSNELYSFEPFALAIQRGDADFQLVADRALSELNRTGRIREIYARWFGRFAKTPPEAVVAVYSLGATPE